MVWSIATITKRIARCDVVGLCSLQWLCEVEVFAFSTARFRIVSTGRVQSCEEQVDAQTLVRRAVL